MRTAGKGHKQPRTPRRAAQFWSPLNSWWRSWLAENERRPVTSELQDWYNAHGDTAWPTCKPSWKEARIHAKCLRSTEQVKNYFREYRARSKAGDNKQEGEDSGSLDGGAVPHEHGGMAGPSQGAPDTLDLLVSSHNARIAQMNPGATSGSSPFASQPQSSGPRTSAPPPMWQQFGKAASERLCGRKSMPDMLDPSAGFDGDRSISFGPGPCGLGPSMSFQANRGSDPSMSLHGSMGDKSTSPFSMVTDRTSCPAPHAADVRPSGRTWSELPPRPSSPQDSSGYATSMRQQRRSTADHPHPHVSAFTAAPLSPASLRFCRSFNPQSSGSVSLDHDSLLEASLTDPSAPAELLWPRQRSQLHHPRIDELPGGMTEDATRRELLRMAVQDALGSDVRRGGGGGLAGAAAMMPAASSHTILRRSGVVSEPLNHDSALTELWALAEDEPVTRPPTSSSSLQPLNQASFMQDATAQLMNMQSLDRASAISDPGPLAPPPYPRSVSFPMASLRTSCLSADGIAPHARPPHAQDPSLSLLSARYSAMASQGLGAAGTRRSSDSCSAEFAADAGFRSHLEAAPSLGLDFQAEPRSSWPNQQDFSSKQQQQQQWAQLQQQQQLQQQLPPMHDLRVNSSRVPMTRREKEEMEQQMLVEAHNQLLWPHQEGSSGPHPEPGEMLGDQVPSINPWADMEWDKNRML